MTALPEAEAKRWLAAARARLSEFPMTVPGPYGDPVSVGHMADHRGGYALLSGFVERNGHLEPIEIEVAAGVETRLDKLRVHYGEGED